ncbi:unknown [Blautia hydrogenotrophica CAG:147]|nr:unknown [Blautia hydrogenotrophica CAG:147]
MAISSSMRDRQMDSVLGEEAKALVSKDRGRGESGRNSTGASGASGLRRHSYGGFAACFAAFVPVEFLGRSGGGNLLVLSDAGDEVFEDREHESL